MRCTSEPTPASYHPGVSSALGRPAAADTGRTPTANEPSTVHINVATANPRDRTPSARPNSSLSPSARRSHSGIEATVDSMVDVESPVRRRRRDGGRRIWPSAREPRRREPRPADRSASARRRRRRRLDFGVLPLQRLERGFEPGDTARQDGRMPVARVVRIGTAREPLPPGSYGLVGDELVAVGLPQRRASTTSAESVTTTSASVVDQPGAFRRSSPPAPRIRCATA